MSYRRPAHRRNPGVTRGAIPKRFKCRYCNKKFKNPAGATLHSILCISNPNR